MKKIHDKTKPRCTTVILAKEYILPVPWLSNVILRFHCSWLSRLKKPQLAEYLRNRCLFSRVTSWLIITVTEFKSLNLNYLWMGKKKLFSTCPIRNYLGKTGKRKLFKHCSTAGIKLNQRILKTCWFDENALDYSPDYSHVLRVFFMSDSQMFLSFHLGLFYNDIKMSTNVSYRTVLYGKLYQGHPATIFCKITVLFEEVNLIA